MKTYVYAKTLIQSHSSIIQKESKSILGVCRTMCTSTGEWINKMWYYMQWNIIWQDRHPDVFYNMDEHWKHYAELVKANTDSSEGDEMTSKERFNLVGLDNSFPNKLQGHVIQICICAIYKWLNGLKDPVKKSKKHVKSKVALQSCPTLCNYWATWTIAHQAPLSMGFSRQKYWSGLPFPSPGDLPNPGTEPASLSLLHWQVGSLPLVPPGKP